MDDLQSNEGSGYINVDLQPPSPRTAPIEIFDFDYTTGSPFSDNSDLSFTADHQLGPIFDTYDPNDFDGPNSASSLLMFNDYYRSPSPSGSDNNDDNRSRASSASSTHTNFQSPNMGVSHSFEGLSFNSPNWQTDPLPPHKPPSPPRLQIDHHQPGIIINAPEDQNNSDLGPQLHIVPATPVSGGAGVVNIASSSPWLAPNSNSDPSSRSPSPVHSSATTPGPSRSPSVSPQPPSSPFLYPQQLRSRSKSDTSLEPPNWDTIAASDNLMQQHHQQQQQAYPATLGSNFTFGTPSQAPNHSSNDFLSPNNFDFQSVTQLRRSRSDVGNAPLNRHRTSRSEDYRFTNTNDNGFLNPNGSSQNMLFPPTSHEDFMRQQLQQQQYLSPSNVRVPELIPTHPTHHHSASLGSHPRGHYRSASGGSRPRSERGSSAGWDGGLDVGSARASPYPSPHASPRGRILSLEREDAFDFASMENNGSQNDDGGSGMGVGLGGAQTGGGGGGIVAVSKPNVTTGRTANASQRRRKQEATFVCPVQGCGSTFTRSFNLKGVFACALAG
ncbi:hypothetical protein C0991_010760 [Blastosporella zonata]|nr:hypothetical protein C0991_010760 [Blastosporella zonata]